jgi:hypothetical protein
MSTWCHLIITTIILVCKSHWKYNCCCYFHNRAWKVLKLMMPSILILAVCVTLFLKICFFISLLIRINCWLLIFFSSYLTKLTGSLMFVNLELFHRLWGIIRRSTRIGFRTTIILCHCQWSVQYYYIFQLSAGDIFFKPSAFLKTVLCFKYTLTSYVNGVDRTTWSLILVKLELFNLL